VIRFLDRWADALLVVQVSVVVDLAKQRLKPIAEEFVTDGETS